MRKALLIGLASLGLAAPANAYAPHTIELAPDDDAVMRCIQLGGQRAFVNGHRLDRRRSRGTTSWFRRGRAGIRVESSPAGDLAERYIVNTGRKAVTYRVRCQDG